MPGRCRLRVRRRLALAAAFFAVSGFAHAQSIELGGKTYASIPAYLAGAWQMETGQPPMKIRMDFTEGGIVNLEIVTTGKTHQRRL